MRFTDQVAIVTGATSGIGLATALRLGAEGARVVVASHSAETTEAAAARVRAAGAPDAWGCVCDVSNEATVAARVAGTLDHGGRLNAVAAVAGPERRLSPAYGLHVGPRAAAFRLSPR